MAAPLYIKDRNDVRYRNIKDLVTQYIIYPTGNKQFLNFNYKSKIDVKSGRVCV